MTLPLILGLNSHLQDCSLTVTFRHLMVYFVVFVATLFLQEQIKEEHRNVAMEAAFRSRDLRHQADLSRVPTLKACTFIRAGKQKPFKFTASRKVLRSTDKRDLPFLQRFPVWLAVNRLISLMKCSCCDWRLLNSRCLGFCFRMSLFCNFFMIAHWNCH